ncbi:unnamed protein product [Tuwongella immobilis]|uniref:Uncharacterized protein n=1 Tax=Tuwongella immobilis TaxID=692036 RepID=A0A6C2YH23_9BACT|nr:unnamed protein product [Tuwongella immobilis]VTR96990.1 unnamed protein product [Tuwongella immobilis]
MTGCERTPTKLPERRTRSGWKGKAEDAAGTGVDTDAGGRKWPLSFNVIEIRHYRHTSARAVYAWMNPTTRGDFRCICDD